jgi:hypothetical protein
MDELNFKFKYGFDHKKPKPKLYRKYESLLVTLRDPIDRLKSAWYWRALVQCRYDQKDETRIAQNNSTYTKEKGEKCIGRKNPDKCCIGHVRETQTTPEYWNRYDGHAYNLAEAFCSDDPSILKQAKQDIITLPHASNTIVKWLGINNNINKDNDNDKNSNNNNKIIIKDDVHDDAIKIIQNKMVAVIVEKGYDFNEQIDGAIEWLLNITFDGDKEMASLTFNDARKQYEDSISSMNSNSNKRVGLLQNTTTNTATQKDNKNNVIGEGTKLHTSKTKLSFPWLKVDTPITDKGSCCLARHFYSNDYELLMNPKFPDWICKGKTKTKQLCHDAILSIIERKRQMLEYALYSNSSCNDIDLVVYLDSSDNDNVVNNISSSYIKGGGVEKEIVQLSYSLKTMQASMMLLMLFGLLIVLIIYNSRNKKERKKIMMI